MKALGVFGAKESKGFSVQTSPQCKHFERAEGAICEGKHSSIRLDFLPAPPGIAQARASVSLILSWSLKER